MLYQNSVRTRIFIHRLRAAYSASFFHLVLHTGFECNVSYCKARTISGYTGKLNYTSSYNSFIFETNTFSWINDKKLVDPVN